MLVSCFSCTIVYFVILHNILPSRCLTRSFKQLEIWLKELPLERATLGNNCFLFTLICGAKNKRWTKSGRELGPILYMFYWHVAQLDHELFGHLQSLVYNMTWYTCRLCQCPSWLWSPSRYQDQACMCSVHSCGSDLTLPLTEKIPSFTEANSEIFLPSSIAIVEVVIKLIFIHIQCFTAPKNCFIGENFGSTFALFYFLKINWLFLSEIDLTNVCMSSCYYGNIEFLFCTAIAVLSMQLSSASTKK